MKMHNSSFQSSIIRLITSLLIDIGGTQNSEFHLGPNETN